MNEQPLAEVLVGQDPDGQLPLALATEGALRYVWSSRWGAMLIEVVGDKVFVNNQRVAPAAPNNGPSIR
jgi:hypothetical protein